MKAAVMRAPGKPLTIEDIEISEPQAGEVQVRITVVGLCHTDISVFHGGIHVPLPIVLGHEGIGVVEKVGAGVQSLKPGDKVLLNALVYCGHCSDCAKGPYGACSQNLPLMFGGRMRNGTTRLKKGDEAIHSFFCQSSLAEYCIADELFTIKLPASVEADKLVALCCGGASGIGAVLNKARVWPGAQVTVMGCGGVGMGAIMAAKLAGAVKIIAVDTLDQKLQLARQFGATHEINAARENVVDAVRQLTSGGSDFAIEAVGNAETIAQSLDLLRPGGTSVVVGAVPFGKKAAIDPIQLLADKTLAGSTIGSLRPHFDIPKYVELYMAGQLPVDKIIQAEFRLDQINEAIIAAEKGEFIKAVIRM